MSTAAEYTKLDDPAFLAARRRVREALELLPAADPGRARLQGAYDELTEEFDRRARAAWQQATS